MSFVLSPRAQADIDDIWTYTLDRWGLEQAKRYVGLIGDAIAAVAANPGVGLPCDDIRAGYFGVRARSHLIFYRRVGADIDVVRVLDGRKDIARRS